MGCLPTLITFAILGCSFLTPFFLADLVGWCDDEGVVALFNFFSFFDFLLLGVGFSGFRDRTAEWRGGAPYFFSFVVVEGASSNNDPTDDSSSPFLGSKRSRFKEK